MSLSNRRQPSARLSGMYRWFCLWLPLAMLLNTPTLSFWLNNRGSVYAQDLILPVILNLITVSLITAVFYKEYKKTPLSAYIAGIICVQLINRFFEDKLNNLYPLIKAFNPIPELHGYEGIFFGFLLVAVIARLALHVGRLLQNLFNRRQWSSKDLRGGLTIFITVTFFLQLARVTNHFSQEWSQYYYRPNPLSLNLQTSAGKPDVYYILLDRYTSASVLKNQFNFDNVDFLEYLKDNQFYVNPEAYSNYPYTAPSVASTLNANYHTAIIEKFGKSRSQTLDPYYDATRYASVTQEMKRLGYSFYQLGTWFESTNQAPLADRIYQPDGILTVLGHSYTLNRFAKNELNKSVYWRLIQHGVSWGNFQILGYSGQTEIEATQSKLKTLKNLAQEPAGNRFIFSHLLVPHDPYYFNADGSLSDSKSVDDQGRPIKDKYLHQVEYINSQMKEIISSIKAKSQNQAVIILQADEGPYPAQLNGENFNGDKVGDILSHTDMRTWSDQDLKMKYGILAAYYLPQANNEALEQGADSVNIFRLFFNTYFGATMEYLPRCYYAYPNGRDSTFLFANINKRLTGSDNPACPENSVFNK